MVRTKIEWVKNEDGSQGYTINPVKGLCPMACSYCYARRMYKRFHWDETVRFDEKVLKDISYIPKGSKIFVGSTMELFGDWIEPEWLSAIFAYCRGWESKTFIFLTKQPQNLIKWNPFPDNCWVGVSVTSAEDAIIRIPKLKDITVPVKFISFEPLLKSIASPNRLSGINWGIIGQQTPVKQSTIPKIEWIQEILVACHNANIPVFMKNNLEPLLTGVWSGWKLRQEFPIRMI